MPNFSWAKPNSNEGRAKLFRPAELIQTPILIAAQRSWKAKNFHFDQTAYKLHDNLCIRFGTWKVQCPNQSCSKGEIPSQARRKEQLSHSKLKQIDSDAKLFMYLIQCIRLGSWEVRRMNRALLRPWLFRISQKPNLLLYIVLKKVTTTPFPLFASRYSCN